jgi:transcriptional regulator with XRE-family HTH domain
MPKMRTQREKYFTENVSRRLSDFAFGTLRLTPKQLSETLGCDPSMVYRIKRGETLPDVAKLVSLWSYAQAQGVPLNIEWLLTGQASPRMPEWPSYAHFEAHQSLKNLSEHDVKVLLPLLNTLGTKSRLNESRNRS